MPVKSQHRMLARSLVISVAVVIAPQKKISGVINVHISDCNFFCKSIIIKTPRKLHDPLLTLEEIPVIIMCIATFNMNKIDNVRIT